MAGLTSQSANATSDYDTTVTNTNSIFSTCYGNSPYTNLDLTTDWAKYLTTDSMYGDIHIGGDTGSSRTDFLNEFSTKLDAGSGWGVSQMLDNSPSTHDFGSVRIYLTDSVPYFTTVSSVKMLRVAMVNMATIQCVDDTHVSVYYNNANTTRDIATEDNAGTWIQPYMWSGAAIDYPVAPDDYEGDHVTAGSAFDIDGDGLNGTQENLQGTSQGKVDTDGDGLSDLVESIDYNAYYGQIFCKQTSPYSCADPNPLEKDLFIEVDWMKDGTTEYKPTSTQLAYAESGLNAIGYNVHFDTGEYGGGTYLSDYVQYLPIEYGSDPIGFFDLKNGNTSESIPRHFEPARQGIWRYLISGYGMKDHEGDPSTISGGTYVGSDNIFVSTGFTSSEDGEDTYHYSDLDTAVAGTIVHEIGHSLCMSRTQKYSYQASNCVHSAVDTYASTTYDSALNYNRQFFQYTLSDSDSGGSDHDDWNAINNGGVDDFSKWTTIEANFEPGLSGEDVQAAIQNGTYGKLVKDGKKYDQLNGKMLDMKNNKVYDLDEKGKVTGLSKNPHYWESKLSQ